MSRQSLPIPGVPPGTWAHTIIVCGGRRYNKTATVVWALDRIALAHKIGRVVTGGGPGADALAAHWARARGVTYVAEPPDWKAHGRAAGPIRNQRMLDDWAPSAVVAFPGGAGTADMVAKARAAGVPVLEVPE